MSYPLSTWREMIGREMRARGESLADAVAMTPPDLELDREFDAGFGGPEGKPFTIWTANFVYFPHEYDGAESCRSVPRNPCEKPVNHGYDCDEEEGAEHGQ